jgi:TetR/AcrR family transcriptional repressor of nem operon
MARTADPSSPTKRKLLEAAERLILEKGFNATTVDDICDCAGRTKGSFYYFFENKDELGKVVLEHAMERRRKMAEFAPYAKLTDPLDRIYGRIDFLIQTSRKMFQDQDIRAGSLIGNLAQELAYTHPDIRSRCAEGLAQVTREMEVDLAGAKAKYAAESSIDPHGLAVSFVSITEGSFVVAKAQQNAKVIESNLIHFKRYLKLLFEK